MSQRTQRRSKRPECSNDNCGSRRFHVGDDGWTYCDQGHQQSELGTVVAEDTGELVTLGKTSRRKDSDAESQTSKVSGFRGLRAFEHYLLCAQLILRKQLRWLIEAQGLPEELEGLVRDLWALRLQKLQTRVTEDSETDTEAASSRMFSSQSEGESGTDAETAISARRRQASRKKDGGPGLTDILCLIHVGIMLLRIPLTIADLLRWINSGQLLFYRAGKELPLTMRDRLPGHFQEMLQPQDLVAADALHRCTLELLSTLNVDFGMSPPSLNHPLILYRWVKELCLPLEIYVAVQRIGRLLHTDFAYSVDAKKRTSMSLRFPEIRLMTLVVIATKLLFPFDDHKRYPKSSKDLAALKIDWPLWVVLQNHGPNAAPGQDKQHHLTFEDSFKMSEADSLELAGERLDEYLDWYEGNIASEEMRERGRAGREAEFRRALFRMFPAHNQRSSDMRARPEIDTSGQTSAEKVLQVQSSLRTKRIVREEDPDDVPRPGSEHTLYRAEEELGGPIKVFYDKCAELAGFSLHGMVRAVFLMERRLMKLGKDGSGLAS